MAALIRSGYPGQGAAAFLRPAVFLVLMAIGVAAGLAQEGATAKAATGADDRAGDFEAALRGAAGLLAAGELSADPAAAAWAVDGCATAAGSTVSGPYRLACYAGLVRDAKATIVVVHGYQAGARSFAPLCRALEQAGYNVVAFDLPGHGASSGARLEIDSFESYGRAVDAVAKLCRSVLGGRLWVLGHSLGALACLDAELREGSDFEGMILVAPLTRTTWWGPVVVGTAVAGLFSDSIPDGAGGRIPLSWISGLIRWRREAGAFRPRPTPGLAILGGRDSVADAGDAGRYIGKKLPKLEVLRLPWMGHHDIESKPPDERLLDAILKDLGGGEATNG